MSDPFGAAMYEQAMDDYWRPYFAHLWDNVALYCAIVAVSEAGYPWPSWMSDYRVVLP